MKHLFKLRGYGLIHAFWLLISLIWTRLFFPGGKIVRLPILVRNLGKIVTKPGLTTGYWCRIDVFEDAQLTIGRNFQLNDFCHLACACSVVIGDDVLVASKVFITDHDHDFSTLGLPPIKANLAKSPVKIGHRVWIGENVSILKGVEIGDDVIVGANSVVTKSIPKNSIAVGNPAKMVKSRSRTNRLNR